MVLLVLAVHAGAAAANLLTGHGAHWPATQVLLTSLPGILAGDSTAAYPTTVTSPAPRLLLWACITVSELAAVTLTGWAVVTGRRVWGGQRIQGMASRREAADLLGPRRLRRVPIVRPDQPPQGGR